MACIFTSRLLGHAWLCTIYLQLLSPVMKWCWHDMINDYFFWFVFSAEDRKSQSLLNKHHHAAHRLSTASWRHRGATDEVMWCWKTIRFYIWGESRQSDFYCSKLELETWGKLSLNLLWSAPSRALFSDLLRFFTMSSMQRRGEGKIYQMHPEIVIFSL